MFEVGFWELCLVIVVSIFVLGPEKLPSVLRVLARYIKRLKESLQGITREVNEEIKRSTHSRLDN